MAHQGKINRREFLHVCALTAAGAGLASCERSLPTGTFTPSAPQDILLNGWNADAWSWTKEVRGRFTGGMPCQEVIIKVNGSEVKAAIEGETFSATVPLSVGENRITATCRKLEDGQGTTVEEESLMLHYYEQLRDDPKAVITIQLNEGKIVLSGKESQASEGSQSAIVDHVWSARPENPEPLMIEGSNGLGNASLETEISADMITISPPRADGEYFVRLRVEDQTGREDTSTIYFVVKDSKPVIPNYDTEHVDWVEHAIVYGIVPFLFGYPSFKGITEKLDYLKELGITALWLAPVNVSPAGDYGYAIADYFDLNPAYGSKEEFHRMIQEAHTRGIKVLMDFVPNHSSDQHPYFKDAQKRGKESPYWTFYDRYENGDYTYYFNWTNLPNLNYANPEVQRWILEAFSYWVREFGVDGFRVDVAWGIMQRQPDFWPKWRKELKRIKPDLLLLAEASARDPYYFDNGFDAAYDWTGQLGKWAWGLVWSSYKNTMLAYNLDAALTNRPDGYHPDAMVFRFLNNNDTGERFITQHGEGMARVSTAMLLTVPGIPCVYTGDEIGAEFEPYMKTDALDWTKKVPGFLEYHKKLISLRKNTPSLHSRLWKSLTFNAIPQEVYGYVRYTDEGDPPAVVLLNFFEEQAQMQFDLPQEYRAMVQNGKLTDLLTDEEFSIDPSGTISIQVPALTARILMEKES